MNNEPIRIKGRYTYDYKSGGYTFHTICDKKGNPLPYRPGIDSPSLLPENAPKSPDNHQVKSYWNDHKKAD